VGKEQDLLQKYFREVPLFKHFPPKHADLILRDFTIRRARKGEILVMQDEEGTELFIILQGRARVVLLGGEGEEFILSDLGEGDFFGEVSLIDAEPRSATVVAETNVVVAALRRQRLLAAIRDEPQIALDLLVSLTGIVRRATEREERFAFLDVRERLCRFFSGEMADESAVEREGLVRIAKRTHKDLASRIGTSRESVTKALKTLVRDGLLREEGDSFLLSPRVCENADRR